MGTPALKADFAGLGLQAQAGNNIVGFHEAEEIDPQRQLLNYVWINDKADPISENPEGSLCSVPLHYLDRAYENARHYPEADVLIWIDFSLLNDSSRYFLQSQQILMTKTVLQHLTAI